MLLLRKFIHGWDSVVLGGGMSLLWRAVYRGFEGLIAYGTLRGKRGKCGALMFIAFTSALTRQRRAAAAMGHLYLVSLLMA